MYGTLEQNFSRIVMISNEPQTIEILTVSTSETNRLADSFNNIWKLTPHMVSLYFHSMEHKRSACSQKKTIETTIFGYYISKYINNNNNSNNNKHVIEIDLFV